ncbi:MAG: transposase [Planctomycetota bacterium]|jgi:hypothetical protein
MPGRRHTQEQIIRKLREAEVELVKGHKLEAVCKKIGNTAQAYCRRRKEFGGLQFAQARRLKVRERENARLKKLVAEKDLDIAILKEVAKGNF